MKSVIEQRGDVVYKIGTKVRIVNWVDPKGVVGTVAKITEIVTYDSGRTIYYLIWPDKTTGKAYDEHITYANPITYLKRRHGL